MVYDEIERSQMRIGDVVVLTLSFFFLRYRIAEGQLVKQGKTKSNRRKKSMLE
jgi:hypothetical protein